MTGPAKIDKPNTDKPWRSAVSVGEISEQGLHRNIEAGEAERQAIAALAGLWELPRLAASFDLLPAGGGRVHVRGRVTAAAGQTCVVTLEPMTSEIDEEVDVMFSPHAADQVADAGSEDEPAEALAEDPPEPIVNDEIDLGALAVEFLLLGLDPYPRKDGVVFEPVITPVDPADHPFAALAALKQPVSPAKPRKTKGK